MLEIALFPKYGNIEEIPTYLEKAQKFDAHLQEIADEVS